MFSNVCHMTDNRRTHPDVSGGPARAAARGSGPGCSRPGPWRRSPSRCSPRRPASRGGLLYHYFGNKQEFHLAVVRRAVEDLVARDRAHAARAARWSSSPARWRRYVDYVTENYQGYVSLHPGRGRWPRGAAPRSTRTSRAALTDRLFEAPVARGGRRTSASPTPPPYACSCAAGPPSSRRSWSSGCATPAASPATSCWCCCPASLPGILQAR